MKLRILHLKSSPRRMHIHTFSSLKCYKYHEGERDEMEVYN